MDNTRLTEGVVMVEAVSRKDYRHVTTTVMVMRCVEGGVHARVCAPPSASHGTRTNDRTVLEPEMCTETISSFSPSCISETFVCEHHHLRFSALTPFVRLSPDAHTRR